MPDDRFGDLGPDAAGDGGRRQSAAERLAELDAREPEPRRRDPRSATRRYTWVVGVAAVILIVIVGAKTLPHAGVGTRGPTVGARLPRFAAPAALGRVNGDANVKQSARDTSESNRTPACDVRGPGVVNVCALESRPLVLTFIGPGTPECDAYVDRVARIAAGFPAVQVAAVVSGRSRGEVATLARRRHWMFPVAVDRNFSVEALYRVSLEFCATSTFARAGGVVRSNAVVAQRLSDAALRSRIAEISG